MTGPGIGTAEQRVLILAPTGKDAGLTRDILRDAGIDGTCCRHIDQVVELLQTAGAAAVLVAEEAIPLPSTNPLNDWLSTQPPWSDLPLLVLARSGADSVAIAQAIQLLGNVTVLERPTRVATLVSAVRSALRARQRQYQIRDHLRQQEQNLRTHAMLAAIVTSSYDAIISKTLDGCIQTWNSGAERLFGYPPEEAIGQSITILIPADRAGEEPLLIERLRKGERIDHFETVRMRKNGELIDISLTVSPMMDEAGKVIGASKVARDITDRKRADAALRDADRRKDEFLAILAHELRNPLAPIRNSLHILRLTSVNDPTIQRVSEMLERQVNHMVRMVDDLLEVSRITRGKIELRKERVEVAAVVRSAVETSWPLLEAGRHQLALSLPPDTLLLEGDAVRLAQAITNLLNNSAKYTDPDGQIWLTVRQDANEVVISVKDNGAGISEEMLPRVFELFTQAERIGSRAQGGLGIGLSLVKSIVELHHGSVTASTAGLGKGSEFVIRLPLVIAPPPETISQIPTIKESAVRRRILVVDDNCDAAQSLGLLLKLMGAEVQVTFSGHDALRILESDPPDVVLLDLGMPEMDGYEVARRIRQNDRYSKTILIALTGWGQEEDRLRTREAGFDHHLIKPADITALETLLHSLEG